MSASLFLAEESILIPILTHDCSNKMHSLETLQKMHVIHLLNKLNEPQVTNVIQNLQP